MRAPSPTFVLCVVIWLAGCGEKRSPTPQPAASDPGAVTPETTGRDLHGDALPAGALARLGTQRFRHEGGLRAWFSRDGALILSSARGDYLLLRADSGEVVRRVRDEDGDWPAALSPKSRQLATAGGAGSIRLWSVETGAETGRLEGHGGPLYGLCFLDEQRLVSGSEDGTVRIWDLGEGSHRSLPAGAPVAAAGVACAEDGSAFAWANDGHEVFRSDAGSPEPELLGTAEHLVFALAISRDGALVAAGSWDEKVRIWSRGKKAPIVVRAHDRSVTGVGFAPEGLLYSSGGDERIRVWDASTGELRRELPGIDSVAAGFVAVSGDGGAYLSWTELSAALRVRRSSDGALLGPARHVGPLRAVAFSPDGEHIATASDDHTARLWEAGTGTPAGVLDGHGGAVDYVRFVREGDVLTTSTDRSIRTWKRRGDASEVVGELPEDAFQIDAIAATPDGETIIVATFEPVAVSRLGGRPYDVSDFAQVLGVALSPDGARLAVVGRGGKHVLVLRVDDAAVLAGFSVPGLFSNFAASFSADGTLLVTAGDDRTVRLWDLDRRAELRAFEGPSSTVRAVAISRDKRRVIAGDDEGTVFVWNLGDGSLVAKHQGHDGEIVDLALSPDGARFVSASADHTALVWLLR